jgi:hypothetical protein
VRSGVDNTSQEGGTAFAKQIEPDRPMYLAMCGNSFICFRQTVTLGFDPVYFILNNEGAHSTLAKDGS